MGYRARIDLDAMETESEAAADITTHDGSAAAHGGAEALAASALQPGDIVWTGEAIATELIASGDGDTVLTAQLTNTPSGPVICHYEGTTRVQGAGECFTISGKQITWLESVGGSGTAPPMAVGENLWFFYGSTGLALGTAAYQNAAYFSLAGALRLTAGATKSNDTSYPSGASWQEITELDTTFTAVAGVHLISLLIPFTKTNTSHVVSLAYRIDGGAWVGISSTTMAVNYSYTMSVKFPVTLTAGSRQIEIATLPNSGDVSVVGSTRICTMIIEGP